jgi:hypothetical protein
MVLSGSLSGRHGTAGPGHPIWRQILAQAGDEMIGPSLVGNRTKFHIRAAHTS